MALKSEKKSKIDKVPCETHREFLDMDTDEEDIGRQETPDTEEDRFSEPQKPTFDKEALDTLVQYVKDITTIPSANDANWNEECFEIIREYFRNPAHTVLVLLYHDNNVKAMFDLPKCAPNGFTYFLRSYWQIYTEDNFLDDVMFGTVNSYVSKSSLKFLENLYAPVVLNSNDCSKFLKDDLYTNLNALLMCLGEEIYKLLGLTVLYVPKENFNQLMNDSTSKLNEQNKELIIETHVGNYKKELIRRLEVIVCFWIKQIRESLENVNIRVNDGSVFDEFAHWKAIYSELKCLQKQLENEEIHSIVQRLKYSKFSFDQCFKKFIENVNEGIFDAQSQLTYLNVLREFCQNFDIVEDVEVNMKKMLLLVLYIWKSSSYYNKKENITILCRALSTEIIMKCQKNVDLDVALKEDPTIGKDMFEKCISVCQTYKRIYDQLIDDFVDEFHPEQKWETLGSEVFNDIEIFISRCQDVLQICNDCIIFGRFNKVGNFGSPRGTEYEAFSGKIEYLFNQQLNEIEKNRNKILNVKDLTWIECIYVFRHAMMDLENMVESLIDDIFNNIENVEEGIEALYSLRIFYQRDCFAPILHEKWIKICRIFDDEAKAYNSAMMEITNRLSADILQRYFDAQYTMMTIAFDWIQNFSKIKLDKKFQ